MNRYSKALSCVIFSLLLIPFLKAQEAPTKPEKEEAAEKEEAKPAEEAKSEGGAKSEDAKGEGEAKSEAEAKSEDAKGEGEEKTAKGKAKEKSEAEGNAEILAYINGLKYNPYLLLAKQADGQVAISTAAQGVAAGETPVGEPVKNQTEDEKTGAITVCTRTSRSVKSNFDNVAIVQPTQGVVYPGALIVVDKHMVDGMPRPIKAKASPLNLRISIPGLKSEGNVKVDDPTFGNVETALNEVLDKWMTENDTPESYKNPARSNFEATETFTSDQMAIKLGAKVGYMAFSAAASFAMGKSAEKKLVSGIYKQVFYTVHFDRPNGFTPDKFFDSSVDIDTIKQAVSNEAPLGYVSSVDYGRLLMFNLEIDKSSNSLEATQALSAAAGAFNASAEASQKMAKVLENSKLNVITLGGSSELSASANAAKSVADLQKIIQDGSTYSKSNAGVPIGYTIKFGKDDTVAKLGATTDFTETTCETLAGRWIQLENKGAFSLRYFEVTYDMPGKKDVKQKSDGGGKVRWKIPADATNVRIFANVKAGHDRSRTLDKPGAVTSGGDFNTCYWTTGTTLSSSDFQQATAAEPCN